MDRDNDRLQREIEEILQKIDDFPTEAARIRAKRKRAKISGLRRRLTPHFSLTAPQTILAGIALILVSYFIIGRVDSDVARWGIIVGLVLFFSGFVFSAWPRRTPSMRVEKRWRGRVIDGNNIYDQPRWVDRVRRWRSRR